MISVAGNNFALNIKPNFGLDKWVYSVLFWSEKSVNIVVIDSMKLFFEGVLGTVKEQIEKAKS